jgi:proteic killer suppression protein
MIEGFRHKGLKRFYDDGDGGRIRSDQIERIADVLFHLDQAKMPGDLDLPGYRLHPLKGDMKGWWSVTISSNWRIIFRFGKSGPYDVDLVDYH